MTNRMEVDPLLRDKVYVSGTLLCRGVFFIKYIQSVLQLMYLKL